MFIPFWEFLVTLLNVKLTIFQVFLIPYSLFFFFFFNISIISSSATSEKSYQESLRIIKISTLTITY